MLCFLAEVAGRSSIDSLKKRIDDTHANGVAFTAYEDLHKSEEFSPGTYVFGNYTLLDGAQRALADTVAVELDKRGSTHRVFNHPRRAKGRYQLLRSLFESGVNEFNIFRLNDIDGAQIRFPVFVRHENDHAASLTPLLSNFDELRKAARGLTRFNRYRAKDLIVVEFCDTSDESGLYRKYSAVRFGERVIPRCLNFADHWIVKHNIPGYYDATNGRPYVERLEEEEAYMRSNPHEAAIRAVFEHACIEYGRVDYALADGRPQIWEINTFPKMGGGGKTSPTRALLRESRAFARESFYRNFSAAIGDHLRDVPAGEAAAISFERRLVEQLGEQKRQSKRREAIRRFIAAAGIDVRSKRMRRIRRLLGPFLRRF